MKFCFFLAVLAAVISSRVEVANAAENVVILTEQNNRTTLNYPVQLGRPFKPGEILDFPQAVIDGVPAFTQANVKQRWHDGSVKHAILSFYIPRVESRSRLRITFQNQSFAHDEGVLAGTEMLDIARRPRALIKISDGTSVRTASVRQMIKEGAFEYWLKGRVATSVVVADHSLARRFDMGFDDHRSLRPVFYVTFFPDVGKIRVRFGVENSNTETLQDQTYGLILQLGQPLRTVYRKELFIHTARSRWTKEFWIGGEPSGVRIDHGLEYLKETRFIFNYDTSKVIPASRIQSEFNEWLEEPKDLYDEGSWHKNQAATGGRDEIGPYPAWLVRWLYTGSRKAFHQSIVNAELAGAWPIHYREGNPAKFIDVDRTIPGIGHVLSVSQRGTIRLSSLGYTSTRPEDRVVPVGPCTEQGWTPSPAHAPEGWSPLYLLTGDYWYLEELWFWASWNIAQSNGAAWRYNYGRGPTGAEGGLPWEQIRSQAWALRTWAHAAFHSPDGSPEKEYFDTMTRDAISIEEGAHELALSDSSQRQQLNYEWGKLRRLDPSLGVPTLHQWRRGDRSFCQENYGVDPSICMFAISNFEQNMMMLALGRAKELGYPTDGLVSYLSANLIGQLTNPQYNAYLIQNGRLPTVRILDGQYFPGFASLMNAYLEPDRSVSSFKGTDSNHGYEFIGMAATSMVRNEPGGEAAWDFMARELLWRPSLSDNPKWAILPRE